METAEKLTENYLTCHICFEVYTDPATLQCDHTFCRPCLLKYIKTQPEAIQDKSIPCPSCRQMTRVTSPDRQVDDWVNQVKPSRLIKGLVEDFGPETENKNSNLCDPCKNEGETTSATSWCPECEESFCDNCLRMHRRFSMTSGHKVTSITRDSKTKRKRRFMCTEHTDDQVKLFCRDCNKAICHICCSIKHRKCNTVVTIESMTSEVTAKLESKMDTTSKKIKEKIQKLTEWNNQKKEILERANMVEVEIKDTCKTIMDTIEQNELKLLGDLYKLKEKQMEYIKAELKSEEITIQMYQQQFEFMDQAVKSECQKDMLVIFESFGNSADDTDKGVEDGPAVERIRFTHDMDKLSKAVDDLQLDGVQVKVVKDGSDRRLPAVLHRTIDSNFECDKKDSVLFDIMVLNVPDGKIIVMADYDNEKIKAFYHMNSNSYQQSVKLPGPPWQIVDVKDESIAISLHEHKQIVLVKLVPDPTIITTIATEEVYYGLSYLSPSKLLGGTNEKSTSFDIFNFSGQVLRSIKTDVTTNPDFIHVTKKKNLIISEGLTASVVSVTSDGEVIFTYRPTGDRALKYPRGITTTSSGDILLTDRGLNKVIQLTESGQFVRDLITGGLDPPRGLCLDDDGLLYVTSRKCLKVFKFM